MKHYYHFTSDKLRDGRPVPPTGEWLSHEGPLVPCQSGLHASEHPFDALKHAPAATLHIVELRGEIIPHGTDKVVARERRIIKTIDATQLLRRFAADCALSVAHLWSMPVVVREYLETLDESKRSAAWCAAESAAGSAAWSAARSAALAAAGSAAWYAAEFAAWSATRSVARYAARDAAAAWYATRYGQRERFQRMVDEAFAI